MGSLPKAGVANLQHTCHKRHGQPLCVWHIVDQEESRKNSSRATNKSGGTEQETKSRAREVDWSGSMGGCRAYLVAHLTKVLRNERAEMCWM